jgi:Secretion system C-terminal sorting domain/IPT/TIG domain
LKKFLLVALLFALFMNVNAQNIIKFEYFIDTDPGVGSATAVSPPASPTVTDFNIPISIASLTSGFHTLYIRGQSTAGEWTHTHFRTFYIVPLLAPPPTTITQVEYFTDTDPGVGAATQAPGIIPSTTITNLSINLDVTSLSSGFHTLYVRSKTADGQWTHTHFRKFYIAASNLPSSDNLVKFEYFFDTDPGFDKGTTAPIAPPVPSVTNQDIFASASNLSIGLHTVCIRSKDSSGDWTQVVTSTFLVVAPPTVTNFTPTNGSAGTSVTITGTNFTGASAVTFGGTAATSFTVVSANSITAVVGTGASGNVSVTTPGGAASLLGFVYNDKITGVEPISNSDRVEIYPNPSKSQEFNLQFPASWQGKNSTIEIMDMAGRIVYSTSSSINQTILTLLPDKSLEAGLYILTVQTEKNYIALKIAIRTNE